MPSGEFPQHTVQDVVKWVNERKVALPDFQRKFEWKPAAVVELLHSIQNGYPIGTLLFQNRSRDPQFELREISSAPKLETSSLTVEHLVLDGQQRITSLFQALTASGNHRFFLDLEKMRSGLTFQESVVYSHKNRNPALALASRDEQIARMTIPFADLGSLHKTVSWTSEAVGRMKAEAHDSIEEYEEFFNRVVVEEITSRILNYRIPTVVIPEDMPMEGVCTIFETINRTGLRLGLFDLAVAKNRAQEINLRSLWQSSMECQPALDHMDIDPVTVLRIVALVATKTGTCTRSDILELSADALKDIWEEASETLGKTLRILRDSCGVRSAKWLPYNAMIVPIAAAIMRVFGGQLDGVAYGRASRMIQQWFWASAFGETYEQGGNARMASDFASLVEWFSDGSTPEVVQKPGFESSQLESKTSANSAMFKAVICMILQRQAQDFYTGVTIQDTLLEGKSEDRFDAHHVFPSKLFDEPALREDKAYYNPDSIVNKVLIQAKTNRSIGKKAPSVYLREVHAKTGRTESQTSEMLRRQLLPADIEGPMWCDDYRSFIDQRVALLSNEIEKLLSGDE